MIYEMIPKAFALASKAFIDIEDAGRIPHILNIIEIYNDLKYEPEYVQVAGILHDIIYRTNVTYEDLYNIDISENAIELIYLVNPSGNIGEYLTSTIKNKYACQICSSNLRYHMNLHNLGHLNTEDLSRIQNYSNTYQIFKTSLDKFST